MTGPSLAPAAPAATTHPINCPCPGPLSKIPDQPQQNAARLRQAAELRPPGTEGEAGQAMADTFLALLWSRGLLVRLLLRVAEAPDEAEGERRARFAVEQTLRIYFLSPAKLESAG